VVRPLRHGRHPDGHGLQRLGWRLLPVRTLVQRGRAKGHRPHLLAVGDRTVCLAKADDWLNEHESEDSAHKSRRWLNQPATDKQLQYLPPEMRTDFGLSRYQASVLMSFQFNKRAIQNLVLGADAANAQSMREVA